MTKVEEDGAVAFGVICLLIFFFFRGFPASAYLAISIAAAMAISRKIPRRSLWSEPLRVVAWSAVLGFLLLTCMVAWWSPGGNKTIGVEHAEELRQFELRLIQLNRLTKTYGLVAWIAVPISLVALVVVGRLTFWHIPVDGVLRARTTARKVVGGIAVASSFSLFAHPSVIGAIADSEEQLVVLTFRHLREVEHDKIIEGVLAKVKVKALKALSSDQRLLIGALAIQAQSPNIPSNKVDFAWDMVDAAFVGPRHRDGDGPYFEKAIDVPFPRARFLENPELFVRDMQRSEEAARAFAQEASTEYDREEKEAIAQILASPLPSAREIALQVVEHCLREYLEVVPSFAVDIVKQLFEVLGDVALEKGTRPIVERAAENFQDRAAGRFPADHPRERADEDFRKAAEKRATRHPISEVLSELEAAKADLAEAGRLTKGLPIARESEGPFSSRPGQTPSELQVLKMTIPNINITIADAERIVSANRTLDAAESGLISARESLRWHALASPEGANKRDLTADQTLNELLAQVAGLAAMVRSTEEELRPILEAAKPVYVTKHPPPPVRDTSEKTRHPTRFESRPIP